MISPVVSTASGAVRGQWRAHTDATGSTTTHAIFLGLPFAAPPVGALRFRGPQPADAWAGVRDALRFGPTPQRGTPYIDPRIPEPSIPGTDTLSVNITTPDPSPDAKLPVLVWIHGGGFIGGSPASPWYGGQAMARDGVVTVSFSYRLAFEGFGWVEGTANNRAVNNRGVRDWIAGLEWVQQNIAAFGGDPGRVTIAGQSAGGSAVMRLLAMPAAQHLFHGVIAVSPADTPATADHARHLSTRIAARLGVTPDAAGFSSVDELTLYEARVAGFEDTHADPLVGMLAGAVDFPALTPAIDGDLIPTPVAQALAAGVGADKALLISSTAHEFNHVVADIAAPAQHRDIVQVLTAAGYPHDLATATAERNGDLGPAWAFAQSFSDLIFRRCVPGWALARAGAQHRTWAYDFRWESSAPGVTGAAHCVDVPFGFDILAAPGALAATGPAPQELADAVHADWLSLITTGAVDAPVFGAERTTIHYDNDGRRRVAPGYELESRLWAATQA